MTSSNEPFRMLLCGRNPEHIQAVTEAVRPEIEVTHQAQTLEAAISVIKSLSENKISLIMMGGGFSPSDYEAASTCHADAKSVPWLRPDAKIMAALRDAIAGGGAGMGAPTEGVGAGAGGKGSAVPSPPAHVVASRARKCIDEHIQELRDGKGKGEVWYF